MPVTGADRERLRLEHAALVESFIAPLESLTVKALLDVLRDALTRTGFTGASLTAAATPPVDLSALGAISSGWAAKVPALEKAYTGVYRNGGLAAFVAATTSEGAAAANPRATAIDPIWNRKAQIAMNSASNRLSGVGDQAWADARTMMGAGIAEGWDLDARQHAVEQYLGVQETRARTVARTEGMRAMNKGALDLALDSGHSWKEWLATKDPRTRDAHWLADGQTVPIDKPFTVDGHLLDAPGDENAPASLTVNCRCTVLFVDPPEGADLVDPSRKPLAGTADEMPFAVEDLKLDPVEGSGLGGQNRKDVYVDPEGNLWLWKPQDRFTAELDVATARLQKVAGLDAPEVFVTTIDGQVGSLQSMFGTKATRRQKFKGTVLDPTKMAAEDVAELQRHHVLDWMIGNYDTHTGQFIRLSTDAGGRAKGQIIAVDKGQAFKHFRNDRLDWSYNPNGNAGAGSVYNEMFGHYAHGGNLPGFKAPAWDDPDDGVAGVVRRLMEMDDDEFDATIRGYAEHAADRGRLASDDVERFIQKAQRRRHSLRDDMDRFYGDLEDAHQAARPTPPELGVEGDPVGFHDPSVRKFSSDQEAAEWAKKHDVYGDSLGSHNYPDADVYEAVRDYTGTAYHDVNRKLRRVSPDRVPDADEFPDYVSRVVRGCDRAMAPLPEDVVLRRGSGFDWLPDEFSDYGRDLSDLVGRVVYDGGYVSTSLGGETSKAAFSSKPCLLNIRARRGTPSTYVDDLSKNRGEREVILGRGQFFLIHDVRRISGSQVEFDVEIVSREWVESSGLLPLQGPV